MTKSIGFTLLEILVVLAVLGILLAISPFGFNRQGPELNRAKRDIQSLIQKSRFEAVKRNKMVVLGLEQNGGKFVAVVDKDNSKTISTGDEPRWEVDLSGYVKNLKADFNPNSGIAWTPVGFPVQAGTGGGGQSSIVLLVGDDPKRKLCIASAGRIRSCDP